MMPAQEQPIIFSPEESDRYLVSKHRLLAYEAIMKRHDLGLIRAWLSVRAFADSLMTKADEPFQARYGELVTAFGLALNGKLKTKLKKPVSPSAVLRRLLIDADTEMRRQGRLGDADIPVGRQDAITGLVVGQGRLKEEKPLLKETLVATQEHLLYTVDLRGLLESDSPE